MQDLTVETVTDDVLAQMATTTDPRLRQVMASLVRHLHDFARDVKLTPDEWLTAIGFLTRVGQTCTPARQEFILLSDVLGLSALVNLMHDREAAELGTTSSLLGPFYRQDAPAMSAATPRGGSMSAPSSRWAIPSRWTVRWGRWCTSSGGTAAGRRISIS
jgi:hydroxyquinol 1,2-dioxygenase